MFRASFKRKQIYGFFKVIDYQVITPTNLVLIQLYKLHLQADFCNPCMYKCLLLTEQVNVRILTYAIAYLFNQARCFIRLLDFTPTLQ